MVTTQSESKLSQRASSKRSALAPPILHPSKLPKTSAIRPNYTQRQPPYYPQGTMMMVPTRPTQRPTQRRVPNITAYGPSIGSWPVGNMGRPDESFMHGQWHDSPPAVRFLKSLPKGGSGVSPPVGFIHSPSEAYYRGDRKLCDKCQAWSALRMTYEGIHSMPL